MKNGLIIGKFMPLHLGHLSLIDFGLQNCDQLYIIICYTAIEPIDGKLRQGWLETTFFNNSRVTIIPFFYNEHELPNTSESSRDASYKWAEACKEIVPDADIIFTSEPYGTYMAEFMTIEHMQFDIERVRWPISASAIRKRPIRYWNYIADAAKSYFVKKVAILGSESTGKTTLTQLLADHFDASFVLETARDIIEKTEDCTFENLVDIAKQHAAAIHEKYVTANKLLFVDTDIHITKSYSWFLFDKKLITDPVIDEYNRCDLYFFLETDCPFVQDGTRLTENQRILLSESHKKIITEAGIEFYSLCGDWQNRFNEACDIIKNEYF